MLTHCKLSRISVHHASLLISLACLLNVGMAQAFSNGPPNSRTGAPGEGNCAGCHGTFPLDSGTGSFIESSLPGSLEYSPESAYTLQIEVTDPNALRWGFEITLIDDLGVQAGALSPLDASTSISSANVGGNTRQYGKQTAAGTGSGTGGGFSWQMQWTAPPEGTGDVTLYGMSNAANNNGGSSGDRIYSLVMVLNEAATAAGIAPLAADLSPNYPNPFNPKTRIDFSLDQATVVRLSIFDARGRLVRVLESGSKGAGTHSAEWDGRDGRGLASPSGLYFARLQNAAGDDLDSARKMTLLQ